MWVKSIIYCTAVILGRLMDNRLQVGEKDTPNQSYPFLNQVMNRTKMQTYG